MERGFGRRPALWAGRRLSTGPPPAFGGRRPHKVPATRIQKLKDAERRYQRLGDKPPPLPHANIRTSLREGPLALLYHFPI
jgi:hypothetical protein